MNVQLALVPGLGGGLAAWQAKLVVGGRGFLRAQWGDAHGRQVARSKEKYDFGLTGTDFERVLKLVEPLPERSSAVIDDAPSRWIACGTDSRTITRSRALWTEPAEHSFEEAWSVLLARVLPVLAEIGAPR